MAELKGRADTANHHTQEPDNVGEKKFPFVLECGMLVEELLQFVGEQRSLQQALRLQADRSLFRKIIDKLIGHLIVLGAGTAKTDFR